MTTNNQCNHAEAIAREMHMYYAAQAHNESNTPIPHWADLTENEQQGWIAVANTALPIIGKHALEDVRAYLGLKASGASTWWKKALYAAGAVIAGAILGGLGMSLSGCGTPWTSPRTAPRCVKTAPASSLSRGISPTVRPSRKRTFRPSFNP